MALILSGGHRVSHRRAYGTSHLRLHRRVAFQTSFQLPLSFELQLISLFLPSKLTKLDPDLFLISHGRSVQHEERERNPFERSIASPKNLPLVRQSTGARQTTISSMREMQRGEVVSITRTAMTTTHVFHFRSYTA